MAKAAPKRKAANGYKLAEPLPKGEILEDISKKKWKLGTSIGQGGFGAIYGAQEADVGGAKYPYVIKIEPHTNGPLFVEMHFYMRNAKPSDVEDFKKEKGLKTFGMPLYLGSGSHEYNGEKYRFVVMEKFGIDLWKIFIEHDRIFPSTTVFKLAIQILDVLEYIHKRGYVHADIKAANIVMGSSKETQNKQVYLVDFGLATKFNGDVEFKSNPKRAHDGTIEYLSRDAHEGVQTRRGDLEILCYNIIQWLGCTLPWEKNLKDPKTVHKSKEEHMESVPKFIKACFEKRTPVGAVVDFLNYLKTLEFDSEPDYKNIRKIFFSGLDSKDTLGKPFQFSSSKKTPVKRKSDQKLTSSPKRRAARKKVVQEAPSEDEKENVEDDETDPPSPKRRAVRKKIVQEAPSEDEKENVEDDETDPPSPKRKAVRKKIVQEPPSEDEKENVEDDETDPPGEKGDTNGEELKSEIDENEEIVNIPTKRRGRNKVNYKEDSDSEKKSRTKRKPVKKTNPKKTHETVDDYDGYTDAMKEIAVKKLLNGKAKSKKKKEVPIEEDDDNMEGYTASMVEIKKKRKGKFANKKGKKTDTVVAATSSKAVDKTLERPSRLKKTQSAQIEPTDQFSYSDSD